MHILTKFGDDWVNIFLVIAAFLDIQTHKQTNILGKIEVMKHQKLYSLVSGPRVHILTKFGDDWVNIFLVIARNS